MFGLRRLANHGWLLPVLLLLLGAALRIGWGLFVLPHSFAGGEIANVALAYARTGILADSFRPGQGPTAHVLPLPPIYAGLVYRAFGVRSATSEMLLLLLSTGFVITGYGLFYRCFGLIGTRRPIRLAGLAFLCLVPMNIALEVVAFRIWEGGLSVALAAGYLYGLLRIERQPDIGWASIIGMALAAAVLAFVSPAFGLAAYLCALLLLVDKLPVRRWPGAVLAAVAALALVITPWVLRNRAELGEAIPLRSNFGLELALGNYAGAVDAADRRAAFVARLEAIHPFESETAFAAMQAAGGEVAYARQLGDGAKAWIAGHPADFARLCVQHARDFFFPPGWLWQVYSVRGNATGAKALLHGLLSALGLIGAVVGVVAAPRRYRFAAIFLVVPALPYLIVQPVLRYRYISYALSVFLAADLLSRLTPRRFNLRPAPATGDRPAA